MVKERPKTQPKIDGGIYNRVNWLKFSFEENLITLIGRPYSIHFLHGISNTVYIYFLFQIFIDNIPLEEQ